MPRSRRLRHLHPRLLEPSGGIHGYLSRFLASGDPTFQHIAIWTLLQLLESEDKKLMGLIAKADDIVDMIKLISNRPIESDNEFEDDDEGEVVNLAQRCLELLGRIAPKPTSKAEHPRQPAPLQPRGSHFPVLVLLFPNFPPVASSWTREAAAVFAAYCLYKESTRWGFSASPFSSPFFF